MNYCAISGKPIEENAPYYQILDEMVLEGYEDVYCMKEFNNPYIELCFEYRQEEEKGINLDKTTLKITTINDEWLAGDQVYYSEMQYDDE